MKPVLNEVWKDADGTLYTPAYRIDFGVPTISEGYWFAFGASQMISEDHPLMTHPMTRVFDKKGNYVAGT